MTKLNLIGLLIAVFTAYSTIALAVDPTPVPNLRLEWPVTPSDDLVSQDYAEYGDYVTAQYHTGPDFAVSEGTVVHAAATGTVVKIWDNVEQQNKSSHCLGNVVIMKHGDGENAAYTLYAHLRDDFVEEEPYECVPNPETEGECKGIYVTEDESKIIQAGTPIAQSSNTGGKLADGETDCYDEPLGEHLHFELKDSAKLGNTADDDWGYILSHPDDDGYHDPTLNMNPNLELGVGIVEKGYGQIEGTTEGEDVGDPAPMRMGPGRSYSRVNFLSINDEPYKLHNRVDGSTPGCSMGWFQFEKTNGDKIDDIDDGSGSLPEVWVCQGNNGVPWMVGSPTSSCDDDPTEPFSVEMNAPYSYDITNSGDYVIAKICSPSDVDYYRFVLEVDGAIDITLEPPTGMDYRLELYNQYKIRLATVDSSSGGGVARLIADRPAGEFFIKIRGIEGSFSPSQDYQLTASFGAFCPASLSSAISSVGNTESVNCGVPLPPSNVSASDGEFSDKVRVSWAEQYGADSYQVYRCINSTESSCSGYFLSANSPYNDTTANPLTTYYYRVKACNSIGCSNFSATDEGFRGSPTSNPSTLINDGIVSGSISLLGETDEFTFEANTGEAVHIRVVDSGGTASFHPQVWLHNPDGTLKALRGNYSNEEEAVFDCYSNNTYGCQLNQTGTYRLIVEDYANDMTGSYEIHFLKVLESNENGYLVNDGVTSGDITYGDIDSFVFEANAGEAAHIRVVDSGDTASFHPQVWLHNPDGTLKALRGNYSNEEEAVFDCYSNNTYGCQLNQTGTYRLIVEDYANDMTGSYEIHFLKVLESNENGYLVNDGVTSGDITYGDIDSFVFEANAGEAAHIRVVDSGDTASFHPQVWLHNPDGTLKALRGNYSNEEEAVFDCYSNNTYGCQLNQTGTYRLIVEDYGNDMSGSYEIHFLKVLESNENGYLVNDAVTSGDITYGDIDSFVFEANAGEAAHIRVVDSGDTASFHPQVWLYNPDGTLKALRGNYSNEEEAVFDCYSNNTYGCQLNQTGTYRLIVEDYANDMTGSYEITFTGPPQTCEVKMVSNGIQYLNSTYEACEILVLGPDYIVTTETNITANSGWEIEFLPGFLIEQGATLDANVCGQSLCMTSPDPMPLGCHTCVDLICGSAPYCCEVEFDQNCLNRVSSDCGLVCEAVE